MCDDLSDSMIKYLRTSHKISTFTSLSVINLFFILIFCSDHHNGDDAFKYDDRHSELNGKTSSKFQIK